MQHLIHRLFGHIPDFALTLEALIAAVLLAAVCAYVVGTLTRSLLTRALASDEATARRVTRRSILGVRIVFLVLLTVVFVPPLLELFGEPLRTGPRLKTVVQWIFDNGLQLLLIGTLAYALQRAIALLLHRLERQADAASSADSLEHAKRTRTLTSLINNVAGTFIYASAGLMMLDRLGINIGPLLAVGSVLGIAVGLGAQTLFKDVLAGLFLIIENQVRVGDSAEINGVSGLVEAINLRTLILRDVRGAVHIFPCGSITTTTNLTKDYAYAVVDVQVPLERDPDASISVLMAVGNAMRTDPDWRTVVIDQLEVLGIDSIGPAGLTIRIRIKTVPQRQWEVAREMRRRIAKEFAARGIDLRMTQRMILAQAENLPDPNAQQ